MNDTRCNCSPESDHVGNVWHQRHCTSLPRVALASRAGDAPPKPSPFALLEAAGLFFEGEDYEAKRVLNLNDVWCWACGGGEEVTEQEAPELARLFIAYGWPGVLFWASEKNGGQRSEFEDNNRFIDFVRNEERIRRECPESSKRAYHKVAYSLGASPVPVGQENETLRQIAAVNAWQADDRMHPLTCGNDSGHAILVPAIDSSGGAILVCKDCTYVQYHIPDVVLARAASPVPKEKP